MRIRRDPGTDNAPRTEALVLMRQTVAGFPDTLRLPQAAAAEGDALHDWRQHPKQLAVLPVGIQRSRRRHRCAHIHPPLHDVAHERAGRCAARMDDADHPRFD